MLRMLVVDDHGPFRRIARMLFDGDGFDVVGESADGRSAIADVERLRPDVMLLDVQLPDLSGFDVAQEVTDRWDPDGPTIVLMSTREGSDYGGRLDTATAAGFLTKAELSPPALHRLVGG